MSEEGGAAVSTVRRPGALQWSLASMSEEGPRRRIGYCSMPSCFNGASLQ